MSQVPTPKAQPVGTDFRRRGALDPPKPKAYADTSELCRDLRSIPHVPTYKTPRPLPSEPIRPDQPQRATAPPPPAPALGVIHSGPPPQPMRIRGRGASPGLKRARLLQPGEWFVWEEAPLDGCKWGSRICDWRKHGAPQSIRGYRTVIDGQVRVVVIRDQDPQPQGDEDAQVHHPEGQEARPQAGEPPRPAESL